MKVDFPVYLDGKTIYISNEVKDAKEAFRFIATMQEMFTDLVCKRNGKTSEHVKLVVRTDDDDNEFYEAHCYSGDTECFLARKSFGVYKDKEKGLFQKVWDEKGNKPLPHNGWLKYNKETKTNE